MCSRVSRLMHFSCSSPFVFVRAVLHVVLPWFPCWCVCFGFSCISVCTVVSVLVGVGLSFAPVLLSVVVSSHVVVSVFVLSHVGCCGS